MLKLYLVISVFVLASCSVTENKKPSVRNTQVILQKQIYNNKDPKQSLTDNVQNKIDSKYCYYSCPDIDSNVNQIINHKDYILSYNKSTKYADWVAYKIDKVNISGSTKKRVWRADPQIPKELAIKPSDYKDAFITCNYDRGHQAPLADFSNSLNWEEVNYLSNITPQNADLNRGAWNTLEARIRSASNKYKGNFYVLTGTYYNNKPTCKLPHARIANTIPNGYWKILTLLTKDNTYVVSFKFDQQTPRNTDFCKYQIELKELTKLVSYPLNLNSDKRNSQELLHMLGCNIR